jgi:23S rRNA (cytosine1962-C5)-methyltransferase
MSVAVVGRRGQARIARGHPWVFRSDVREVREAGPGDVVRILGPGDEPLGFALYSSLSEIRLRLLTRATEWPEALLRDRLAAAVRWREEALGAPRLARLVHGEGDGLPSLVVDRYGDILVMQTLSQGMEARRDEIADALEELLRPAGILERNDPRVRELEGLERRVGVLRGTVPETVVVEEDGVRFDADLRRGQKTGLFLDQRENHLMARSYARGRVLDGFCYDGGFGLSVAGQAADVLCLDSSSEALARLARNVAANGFGNVRAEEANVFDRLRALEKAGERFDTVILDPPAFAKSKAAVETAWRGYKEINLRALRLLGSGGHLITCSCSYHIHEPEFEAILAEAAADTGATVTVVEKRRQARDHPVVLGVPETYYLKCFVLRKLPQA